MQEKHWEKIESLLPRVARPGRYVGNELNTVKKDWESVLVSFALAFPDVYEIGMSHVGMGILYHILNRIDWVAAERVYSPWIDMEKLMRDDEITLFSLESKKPIHRFDILGITLQYELHYTNILNLLDLSGIPVWSKDRQDKDPLVLAGGPCAYNPEPLADFLDAVVLGDGEEIVVEIAEVVRKAKRERQSRQETLRELSTIEGIYVPSLYRAEYGSDDRFTNIVPVDGDVPAMVGARTLNRLSNDNYPDKPLVPMIEITHDRFSMEIMRGCSRGCRFCNAGMIYRPVRERRANDLLKHAKEVVDNTGFDEISLISLSTSDYGELPELLQNLRDMFQNDGISISLPSLRPDTFTPEIADFIVGFRKSGLTLAPEAGSQRLRDVINKNNREEDLFRAVEIAFQKEWRHLKLYFMIGLPTERQDDLDAIVDLVDRLVRLSRRYGKKELHVSMSPFCPKPQTPFQWESQDSIDTMEEKVSYLKRKISWKEVKLSWRDPRVSRLETILGRGDRRLASVIYRAWKEGARFDAWSDKFDYDRWLEAFRSCDLSVDVFVQKKEERERLPWDHLGKGISKSFLIQEQNRALAGQAREDCRVEGCMGCGLMEHPECRQVVSREGKGRMSGQSRNSESTYGRRTRRVQHVEMSRRIRIGYRKGQEVRFSSHLDMNRIFIRALRRARIPVALSQGYRAHPKISTGPPLSTGFTSRAEYFDLEVRDGMRRDFDAVLNRHLPEGIEIFRSKVLLGKTLSLNESITRASYEIGADWRMSPGEMAVLITEFMKKNSCRVIRIKKGIDTKLDIRPFVVDMSMADGHIRMMLRLSSTGTARVEEVIHSLFPHYEEVPILHRVERTGLFIESQGSLITPLDVG